MNKYVLTKDLFDCKTMYLKPLFDKSEYPWQILPLIKEYIKTLNIDKTFKDIYDKELKNENN